MSRLFAVTALPILLTATAASAVILAAAAEWPHRLASGSAVSKRGRADLQRRVVLADNYRPPKALVAKTSDRPL